MGCSARVRIVKLVDPMMGKKRCPLADHLPSRGNTVSQDRSLSLQNPQPRNYRDPTLVRLITLHYKYIKVQLRAPEVSVQKVAEVTLIPLATINNAVQRLKEIL